MICRKKMLFLCLSVLLCSLFFSSSSASAFNLGTVGGGMFDYGTNGSQFSIYFNPVDGTKTYKFNHPDGSNYSIVGSATGSSQVPSNGQMINLWLRNQNETYKIPASSLVSFSIRYVVPGNADYLQFNGLNSDNYISVLSTQCKANNILLDNSLQGETDFVCQYLVYVGDDYTVGTGLSFENRIAYIRQVVGITMIVSSYTYARVSDASGGGSVDLDNIEDLLQDIVDQLEDNNYSATISNIAAVLENIEDNQPSAADIAQAISDAEEEEMLDAQDSADTDASASQTQVQGATTSLLSVLGQFVTALTTANATNCIINGDLVPHLPLGQLDLCSNSPPAALTALGSLILIAFIIPLAYSTVKRIITLIGEFQR